MKYTPEARVFPERSRRAWAGAAGARNEANRRDIHRSSTCADSGGILARAQAPSGPISPKPGVEVQQAPKDMPKVRVQVALVNTPVTVRDARGEMVHDLEARDFQIADNGVAQKISHFDLGGDPIRWSS